MADKARPLALFYGGTNGSGKSSLRNFETRALKHIDPDAIAREMNPKDARSTDAKAGREAIKQFKDCITNKTPFSMESTLSGNSAIRRMEEALNAGFNVELQFIGLEDVSYNIKRVAERVQHGGHHIDEDIIRKRYSECLDNLHKAVFIANETTVFDNTNELTPHLAIKKNRDCIFLEDETPCWIKEVAKEYNNALEQKRKGKT